MHAWPTCLSAADMIWFLCTVRSVHPRRPLGILAWSHPRFCAVDARQRCRLSLFVALINYSLSHRGSAAAKKGLVLVLVVSVIRDQIWTNKGPSTLWTYSEEWLVYLYCWIAKVGPIGLRVGLFSVLQSAEASLSYQTVWCWRATRECVRRYKHFVLVKIWSKCERKSKIRSDDINQVSDFSIYIGISV